MKTDGIHQDFFPVPELPHKKKEREAILLLKEILILYNDNLDDKFWFLNRLEIKLLDDIDKDLIDWIMKYKGE